MARKPKISSSSVWLLCRIDHHIRSCGIKGTFSRFLDVAGDSLDGLATRAELRDLIRRRFLTIIHYGFDDSLGRDPDRDRDPNLCGTSWSVNPTARFIRTFWPERLAPSPHREG